MVCTITAFPHSSHRAQRNTICLRLLSHLFNSLHLVVRPSHPPVALDSIRIHILAWNGPISIQSWGCLPCPLSAPIRYLLSPLQMYIGRAKVSLKNIIEQTSDYLTLPLVSDMVRDQPLHATPTQ